MQPQRIIYIPRYRNFDLGNTSPDNCAMVKRIEAYLPLGAKLRGSFLAADRRMFVGRDESFPYAPFRASPLKSDDGSDGGISYTSTASSPFAVAHMLRLLGSVEGKKILEIGTGSGYQTAILADLVGPKGRVVASETIPPVLEQAKNSIILADTGRRGWFSRISFFGSTQKALLQGPFDAILVCCAVSTGTLHELAGHLAENGGIVAPVSYPGSDAQNFTKYIPKRNLTVVLNRLHRKFVPFRPESEPAME